MSKSEFEEFDKEFENEVLAMCKMSLFCKVPNLLRINGFSKKPKHSIVMEYMPGGTLLELLKSEKIIEWPKRIELAQGITRGVNFLHSVGYIHRDIKSNNVLLDNNYVPKISDFGLIKTIEATASYLNATSANRKAIGTPSYMAPELDDIQPVYTEKSDIYALGIVFWEISARKTPYKEKGIKNVRLYVQKGERETIPVDCPKNFAKIIETCWDQNPKNRPNAEKVLNMLASINLGNKNQQHVEEEEVKVNFEPNKSNANDIKKPKVNDKLEKLYNKIAQKEQELKAYKGNKNPIISYRINDLMFELGILYTRCEDYKESEKYFCNLGAGTFKKGIEEGCLAYVKEKLGNTLESEKYYKKVLDEHELNKLHISALLGDLAIVKYLIEEGHGYSKNMVDELNKRTPFHWAAYGGTLEIVKYLIGKGCKKDVLDSNSETPLHLAAAGGNLEVVKYLIEEKGCNKNAGRYDGETPLHRAIAGGDLEIVKYLIEEQGCDKNVYITNGRTLLFQAVSGGNLEVVKYLIEQQKYDINVKDDSGYTPLQEASRVGKLEIVKYLIEHGCDKSVKDKHGRPPLHEAAYGGNLEIVKYLIDQGCDKNVKNDEGITLLHCAATGGNLELVKYLIEQHGHGYNKNVKDKYGRTPFHNAATNYSNNVEVVKYLIKQGCDIDFIDNLGITPLCFALCNSRLGIAKYLIEEQRCDINIKYGDRTLLHWAIMYFEKERNKTLEIVKCLIEHGCDKNVKDKDGKTPLDLAKLQTQPLSNERTKLITYLEKL